MLKLLIFNHQSNICFKILIDLFQSLSIDTADANNSTVILANDPDADRLAIAEKLVRYIFQSMYIQDNKNPSTNKYHYCITTLTFQISNTGYW